MSNTLNTPIEAFEMEYPMRRALRVLYDSGGEGEPGRRWHIRAVRVLEPASLSLLTDRRRHGPRGVDGRPSRVGRNLLGGEELPPKVSRSWRTET